MHSLEICLGGQVCFGPAYVMVWSQSLSHDIGWSSVNSHDNWVGSIYQSVVLISQSLSLNGYLWVHLSLGHGWQMGGLLLLVWIVTCMDLGMHHTSAYIKTFRLAARPIFTDRGLVIDTSCTESSFPQSSTSWPLILRVTSSTSVVFLRRS
jgi:hypothetical protein